MSEFVNIYRESKKAEPYRQQFDYYSAIVEGNDFQLGLNELDKPGETAYCDGRSVILEQQDFENQMADMITTYSYSDSGIFTSVSKFVKGSMRQSYVGFQIDENGTIYRMDFKSAQGVYRDLFDRSTLLGKTDISSEEINDCPIINNDNLSVILEQGMVE